MLHTGKKECPVMSLALRQMLSDGNLSEALAAAAEGLLQRLRAVLAQ